jgi:hypothetical protein
VQEQLLGFINELAIPLSRRHHVAKFAIGQESPPPSPSKKRNPTKKNQHALDSLVNKKSK